LQLIDFYNSQRQRKKIKTMHHRVIALITMYPLHQTWIQYSLPVTKQNRFLPITIDEQQGLNKHHESRVIIAAIKTLIIRAIIAQNIR